MAKREIVVELQLSDTNAVAELGRLEIETKQYQRELKALNAEIAKNGQATRQQQEAVGTLNASIRRNQTVIRELKNDLSGATGAGLRFRDKMAEASRAGLAAFGFQALTVTGAVTGLVSVLKSASQTVEKFDAAQSNLAAILNTNKEGISSLTEEAKKYGATTAFTASQVSELQTELAKLGFTQGQIKDATPAVLDLAAATGTDLGNAATIAAQTLNAFQLEASETQRVVDVIAQSANLSAFNIDTFSAAMSNAAPAAKSVGIEIEQASAMLSALVDAGIPAEKAGTDLRNIFISLAEKGMTLDEAFSVVRGSQDQLTTAVKMFDQRAAGSAIILAENTDKLKRLEEGYIDAAGAAEQMAKTQLDNLKGDKLLLTSAWEGFVLSVEDGGGRVTEVLRGITGLLTDVLSSYSIMIAKSDDLLARQVGTGNGSALRAEASAKAYLDEAKAYLSSREQMILEDEDIAFRTISAEQAVARAQIDRAKSDGTLIQLQDVLSKKLRESEAGSQQYAFTMIRLKEITKELAVQDADQAKALDASTKATVQANKEEGETIADLRKKLKGLKEGLEELDVTDTAGIAKQQAAIAALEKRIKAIDGTTEATKKLTAAQLAQLDAENNVRSDALGNIFAQTGDGTTTPAVELQKEEGAELDSIVEQGLANRNALREEARIRDIKGIVDLNAERALLEAEWQSGSIASYEEYLARKDNLRRAEVENEMAALDQAFGAFQNFGQGIAAIGQAQTANEVAEYEKRIEAARIAGQSTVELEAQKNEAIRAGAQQAFEIQRALTLAQIAVDTAKAISSLVAASAGNPTNAVTFGAAGAAQFAAGAIQIAANMAQAIALLSSRGPGFEEGGYTSRRRRDDEPVGVVHANEYVVPAPIVRNPRGKRLIDELERMRMGHPVRYAPPFIGGGIGTNNNVRFARGTGLAQTGITAADVATADLSRAIMSMPAPVVRVDEINRVQRRVNVIESISRT